MGIIRLLDDHVASQIAAGEVIERPASVAKELIENAKDAGARRIDVAIWGGGLERMTFSDDGCGMSPDDARLCFSRHATSKLRHMDDLKLLATYGFRGEALAAISAVSKVRLLTKAPGADAAYEVLVDAGHIVREGEAGGADGTLIDVQDLFYAVPARKKFLKTPRTEQRRVLRQLRSQALCTPRVTFSLRCEGRDSLFVAGADTDALDDVSAVERAVRCLGEEVRGQVYPVHTTTEKLSVRGYITAPGCARRSGDGLYLAVNGRPVSDRALSQTVRMAFRQVLPTRHFPVAALDICVDGDGVDVNVHPRKDEVRFEDERRVHAHLLGAVSDLLARAPWQKKHARTYVLNRSAGGAAGEEQAEPPAASAYDGRRERIKDALARFEKRSAPTSRSHLSRGQPPPSTPAGATWTATAGGRFLLVSGQDALTIIDAARVLCADACTRLAAQWAEVSPPRLKLRTLLFPLRLEREADEVALLDSKKSELLAAGVDLDAFSETGLIVRAYPEALTGGDAEAVLSAFLAHLLPRLAAAPNASLAGAVGDRLFGALAEAAFIGRTLSDQERARAFSLFAQNGAAGARIDYETLAARLKKGSL